MNLNSINTKELISRHFKLIVIGVLLIIVFLQRCFDSCNHNTTTSTKIVTKRDTAYITKRDTITKEVKVYVTKYKKLKGVQYTPSNNIDTCKQRFNLLLNEFSIVRIYKDTIPISNDLKLGTLIVTDTVWTNRIINRQIFRDIKFPKITETVTITNPPKRQFYAGGILLGNKEGLNSINPGFLYKDKKDRIFSLNGQITFDGNIYYGGGMYWKFE